MIRARGQRQLAERDQTVASGGRHEHPELFDAGDLGRQHLVADRRVCAAYRCRLPERLAQRTLEAWLDDTDAQPITDRNPDLALCVQQVDARDTAVTGHAHVDEYELTRYLHHGGVDDLTHGQAA